jgi:hypothetical protein
MNTMFEVDQPVAWQPKYKQEVIDHHRSIGSDLWEYAMTVYRTREAAENYGGGGHEARPLYANPSLSAPDERLETAIAKFIEQYDFGIKTLAASEFRRALSAVKELGE